MDNSEFLKQDFSECFGQLRHYDTIIIDSFKFIFTIYVALIGGAISIFDLKLPIDLLLLSKLLIIISIVFCFFVLFYIIEQRVYFVKVARYINEIRDHYLTGNNLGFKNLSNFYHDKGKPEYFSLTSSHIILAIIVSALNSFSIGLLLYVNRVDPLYLIVGLAILSFSIEIYLLHFYLNRKEKKNQIKHLKTK